MVTTPQHCNSQHLHCQLSLIDPGSICNYVNVSLQLFRGCMPLARSSVALLMAIFCGISYTLMTHPRSTYTAWRCGTSTTLGCRLVTPHPLVPVAHCQQAPIQQLLSMRQTPVALCGATQHPLTHWTPRPCHCHCDRPPRTAVPCSLTQLLCAAQPAAPPAHAPAPSLGHVTTWVQDRQ